MSEKLSLTQLREKWQKTWNIAPHPRIGRAMLEKSLAFKENERALSSEQHKRLKELIAAYKRSPHSFETSTLKPGTRLERIYHGQKHSVLVTSSGYDYQGVEYKSLSKIANHITGSKWNGWLFFGLNK